MDSETILQKAGFTQNEVKAYLTLLKIGRSTSYDIVKEAKVSSGKIYETLDRLIEKGIVSYIIMRGKKYFEASEPERLLDFMKKRELETHEETQEISKIIPVLKAKNKFVEKTTKAEIYEGISGIKSIYELMLTELKSGETILILGASKEAGEKLDIYFDNFNRRRIEKNISLKIILNFAHPREKKLKSIKKTQIKVFSKDITTAAWINIFGNYVATFNLAEEPVVFLIKNEKIAASYKQYFELMWKKSAT
jgi:sugar-specific transcriptional regulator TrmB